MAIFHQLPSLVLSDGKIVSQSGAIIRYIARLANLVPKTEDLLLDADMMVELAQEMNNINPILNWYDKDSAAFETARAAYFASLPEWLASAARLLEDKPFFGGDQPSYGDFAFFAICDNTLTVDSKAINGAPAIMAWVLRMKALPSIVKFLSEPRMGGRENSLLGH